MLWLLDVARLHCIKSQSKCQYEQVPLRSPKNTPMGLICLSQELNLYTLGCQSQMVTQRLRPRQTKSRPSGFTRAASPVH
jgi:hypothetical protein